MDTSPSGVPKLPQAIFDGSVALFRSAGGGALADAMRNVAKGAPPNRPPAALRSIERMGVDRYWSRIRAKLGAMDSEAFARLGVVLHEQTSVEPRLAEIKCQTLVIVGEQDAVFLEPAALLAASIPNANLVTVKDAAHSPQIENGAAWLAAIEDHLTRARS
jgi:pimeloyl-ACP methyl ester carboxylesterase